MTRTITNYGKQITITETMELLDNGSYFQLLKTPNALRHQSIILSKKAWNQAHPLRLVAADGNCKYYVLEE